MHRNPASPARDGPPGSKNRRPAQRHDVGKSRKKDKTHVGDTKETVKRQAQRINTKLSETRGDLVKATLLPRSGLVTYIDRANQIATTSKGSDRLLYRAFPNAGYGVGAPRAGTLPRYGR